MTSCPSCGEEIGSDTWPSGLCPRCLFTGALGEDESTPESAERSVTSLSSGTNLGPFVIIELLGKGGMAAVYHAYETELDRDVALKVLPPEFLHDGSFARRFEREAQLVARLEHPHIVPIYASGIEAGIPWMSMRLLTGGSLDRLLKREKLGVSHSIKLLQEVAEALEHAHANGVVHRDIKPSNLLLDEAGHVCVGDFGLARVAERSLVQTLTAVAGTPHYMAPEQASGGQIDRRCDIYSLGVVAYELLTWRLPFEADSPLAVLMKHASEPVRFPDDEGISASARHVVEKCLAKKPDDRWPSASAFVTALAEAEHRPGSIMTPGDSGSHTFSPEPVDEPPRPRSARRWAAAAGVVVAMVAASWLFVLPDSTGDRTVVPPTERDTPARQPEAVRPLLPPALDNNEPPAVADIVPSPELADRDASREIYETNGAPVGSATERSSGGSSSGSNGAPLDTTEPSGRFAESEPIVAEPASGIESRPASVEFVEPFGTNVGRRPPPPASDSEPAIADTVPVPARTVSPAYPPLAIAADIEGDVVLLANVGPDGFVREVTVLQSAHRLLEDPARRAVMQYEYTPGIRAGSPAEYQVETTVRFRLD